MNALEERNTKLFNSPMEIGLRTLFVLNQFGEIALSIDKLIFFDYFLIHAGDISKKQKSIHPKYPFRSSEIIIKRELLNSAIMQLVRKELIEIHYQHDGIFYTISNIGRSLINYFESEYAELLNESSQWIYKNYKDKTEEELQASFKRNMKKWGGEFANESKFR